MDDPDGTDLTRLADDVRTFAELIGAPCDPAVVARTLETFAIGFRHCPIELRTTFKAGGPSDLSFRYVDPKGTHDPWRLAVDAGVLSAGERPVDRLIPELQARFRIFGYGVDATAEYGLEKIWPFFDKAYPLEDAFAVTALPPSMARSEPWLRRHGLTHLSIIAADFRSATTNLYFLIRDRSFYDQPRLAQMIAELGFAVPDGAVLARNAGAPIINVTYSWRSDAVERLCFYVLAPTAGEVPVDQHPMMRRVVEQAPVLGERMFVVGSAFYAGGAYTKLEIDYTGNAVPLLQRWVARHVKS